MYTTRRGLAGPLAGVAAGPRGSGARRNTRCVLAALLCLTALGVTSTAGAQLQVVATIKPVHSLVAGVMVGTGEPKLIIRGATSPHTFSLRPSDARNIQNAEVIFMIGDALETSLAGSIDTLSRDASVVRLADTEGLIRLPLREGATFETRDHESEHEHEAHEEDSFDMHVWLDPLNARTMVSAIAETLSAADADNAATYAANAETMIARLDTLVDQVNSEVGGLRDRPFIVFHEAYHYLEDRFGLIAAGAASVSPDRPPGARRISELRTKVSELGVVCVLAEPQFDPRIASVIIEGTSAQLGTVDPLGASLDSGRELYFTLLHDMAASFAACLAPDAL